MKNTAADHDVGLVTLANIGLAMRASADHARAYVGEDNVVEDWSGAPAVPTVIARDAVSRFRADEDRRYREERAATIQRETRDAAIRELYREKLATKMEKRHKKLVNGGHAIDAAYDDWGSGVLTPTAQIVAGGAEQFEQLKREAWAEAEKEVDRRG